MNVHSEDHGSSSIDGGTRESGPGRQAAEPDTREGLLAGGAGRGGDCRGGPFEVGFRDPQRTITVIASGPSAGTTRPEHRRAFPAICVNDAWRLHPEAEALYAADPRWWQVHGSAVEHGWKGGRTFTSHTGRYEPGLRSAGAERELVLERQRVVFEPGLSRTPGVLHAGGTVGNSGAQAINLAAQAGPWRILLLGFDMRKVDGVDHFFGAHPAPLNQTNPYEKFWQGMWSMAMALNEQGIEVLNGSPGSALPYWPKLSPAELDALCAPTC